MAGAEDRICRADVDNLPMRESKAESFPLLGCARFLPKTSDDIGGIE